MVLVRRLRLNSEDETDENDRMVASPRFGLGGEIGLLLGLFYHNLWGLYITNSGGESQRVALSVVPLSPRIDCPVHFASLW
jgi:hypothetical protein